MLGFSKRLLLSRKLAKSGSPLSYARVVRGFSDNPSDEAYSFKGHPLPPCTAKHHLRIESQESYKRFLKAADLKKKLFWAKLGLLGVSITLVPVMGGVTGMSAGMAGLAIVLLSLDKRVGKYLRKLILSQTEERNMINIDVQKY